MCAAATREQEPDKERPTQKARRQAAVRTRRRLPWLHAASPRRRQLGLFDNPVGDFSLEELVETVSALERERPGRTADELSRAVFAELPSIPTRTPGCLT